MRKLKQITFLSLIFVITAAFNFQHNPPSNWYQQYLPSIYTQQINDMTFLDSLTGFIVTSRNVNPDTAMILKTTNGGDNLNVVYSQSNRRLSRVKFINNTTGFASGGTGTGTPHLYKTTNQGLNWNLIPVTTGNAFWEDMSVLNEDTIWCVDKNSLNGGVYRTTNGGGSWQFQYGAGSQNPRKIYMFNSRIGFIYDNTLADTKTYKTTNSGVNWFLWVDGPTTADVKFIDSLTGWRAIVDTVYKTTNGGDSWIAQRLPSGGIILDSYISKFCLINKDTIWGIGGFAFYGAGQFRGLFFKTTNGGNNWGYQIPDTSMHNGRYSFINFINKNTGWAYLTNRGIHTKQGGDSTIITFVSQTSTEIPKQYSLSQNYPNPFNPITIINYQLTINSFVMLKVFDISGKEVAELVNKKQSAGSYSVDFNGEDLSSGIYFYSLQTEDFKEIKKMMLIK